MSKSSKEIGQRLRTARFAAGYRSARDFTTQFSIPESTFSQHETGARSIKIDQARQYCEYLRVDLSWLLTGHSAQIDREQLQQLEIQAEKLLVRQKRNLETISVGRDEAQLVHIDVLFEIFRACVPVFKQVKPNFQFEEIIEFCMDVYNSIVSTSADLASKDAMIQLSVSSLKRGVTHGDKILKTLEDKQSA